MKHYIALLTMAACSLTATVALADGKPADPSPERPCYLGTSAFMLMNLVPDDESPYFVQINGGYQLSPQDRLSFEAITWRYYRPIGIPLSESPDPETTAYPGHVREYGLGLSYQRMVWKGAYTSIAAVPFLRQYFDRQGGKIGNGFQLFLTARLGYHLRFLDRFFLEPSLAFNYWPISTNVPPGFREKDAEWPSYFLFEPGLHMGVTF